MNKTALAAFLSLLLCAVTTVCGEDETEDGDQTTTDTCRSHWTHESDSTDLLVSPLATSTPVSALTSPLSKDTFLSKRNPDDIIDSRPTRKVYGVDNRGDRELYPELIIEPSVYDRYEVYETDRDGLKKWEPKAIIKQGLHDRYEVYKTDRDGLAVDEPHLIIEEGRHGDQKVYQTDRYGMREDIPSRVIKTDRRGRQEVYRTDRYGMPIGDPIDEKILE
jgi:hypothetical protein